MNEDKKNGDTINANISANNNSGQIAVGSGITQTSNTLEKDKTLSRVAAEVKQLLEQISLTHPTSTPTEKLLALAEATKQIENNPSLKVQVINVLNQFGMEAFKAAVNHPLVNILVETFFPQSNTKSLLSSTVKKILILSVNPIDTNQLRLDEEIREIQAALKRSKNREQFEIVTQGAVRVDDLRRSLLDHQPTIVHFSGHGSGSAGLVLENNSGQVQLVSTESLARLFKAFQNNIECVLLNACYSENQAEAIHKYIDYVIGMNRAIGDKAAIDFAVGFYDALGAGKSYEDCFEFGCGSIDLKGIPESETPVIKARQHHS
ncbi:MAG: CHAT domain-containing protein [Scytonema sp. PMC 1069.18]|nr:CHAT domain-containing protein [Scytonema sp. PMC 1069.18]MEC4883350.1 CHAT domain-containing protein [Scytonema sp. PMC 1070.18]